MQSNWKATYKYGNIGLELVLSIVVGFLLGRWVDRHVLGGHGYGTIVGTLIGVYTGFRSLFKMAKQMQVDSEADDKRMSVKVDTDAKVEAYKKEADAPEDDKK